MALVNLFFRETETMCKRAITVGPAALFLMMLGSTLVAADEDALLFDFSKPDAAEAWVKQILAAEPQQPTARQMQRIIMQNQGENIDQ